MKLNRKIIVSVLLALTIVLMFVPIAKFTDNSVLEYDEKIAAYDKKDGKIERAQKKVDRYIAEGKAQDKIDKEQEKLDELIVERDALVAERDLKAQEAAASAIQYSLLPDNLPVPNNNQIALEADIQAENDIIKKAKALIDGFNQLDADRQKVADQEKVIADMNAAATAEAPVDADKLAIEETKLQNLKDTLAKNEAEFSGVDVAAQQLIVDEATVRMEKAEKDLADHKEALNASKLQVDMVKVNEGNKIYPTNFDLYNTLIWVALGLLVISIVFIWLPMDRPISKFYTYASFTNLFAVLVLAYLVLRLGGIPIKTPYSNPAINELVAWPLILLPVVALLIHCSSVTNTKRSMLYVLCTVLCALSLLPFWIMLVNATRSSTQIQSGVSLLPSDYFVKNWTRFQQQDFNALVGFKNSAIIAFGSTALSVYFSALTAYGLTVYKFKGHKLLYAIILAIIMIPGQVTGTGFTLFMHQIGWRDSFLPLIIPSIAAASTVFFFKQYLEANFQVSLVEAARIDGAGEFYTYNKIVMPIMVPAMATMAIMAVIGSWNNYMTPLMLLTSPENHTLPMMVKELRGDIYKTDFGLIYVGLSLTALPLMIVYFAFSKYIIAGVAVGGVKE